MKYHNPIISGYNPDPCIICDHGEYYLVNSSFEYFPGVPLYHSKNLVNWDLAGYCLSRKSQDELDHCPPSAGIYAPMLCAHDGWYFLTTTNVSAGGNFIIHSRSLTEGWSDPVYVDQQGIDPSLFFDEDGKVYFTSTGLDENGNQGIMLCEVDPFTGKKLSASHITSYGNGGRFPEGPHLYHIGNYYYLMVAEGGTEYGHMETILRGPSPDGPWEKNPDNPILKNKDSMKADVFSTGHADLLEDANGNWWLVCLGTRRSSGALLHHLGRETFLAPLTWKNDWPVVNGDGVVMLEMEGNLPGPEPTPVNRDFIDDFDGEEIPYAYNWLRNPYMENYRRDPEQGNLVLKGTDVLLNAQDSPTWIGVKQKEYAVRASVTLKETVPGAIGGLTAYYNKDYYYALQVLNDNGVYHLQVRRHLHDLEVITEDIIIPAGEVKLIIKADAEYYHFIYEINGSEKELAKGMTAGLSTEGTWHMTFTGVYMAMFAEHGEAVFSCFRVLCD